MTIVWIDTDRLGQDQAEIDPRLDETGESGLPEGLLVRGILAGRAVARRCSGHHETARGAGRLDSAIGHWLFPVRRGVIIERQQRAGLQPVERAAL